MFTPDKPKHWQDDAQWKAILAAADDPIHTLQGDVVVHTYQSAYDPYFTSSYFFETEKGVVLVDTQIFRSAADDLWEHIKRKTSGEIAYIVNTHAHPDHYFGNTLFREVAPNAAIITSAGVLEDIQKTAAPRVAKTNKEWGNEVPEDPSALVFPNVAFEGTLTLSFDQITLVLQEYGPAEAPVQVCGWIPEHRALITADILQNKQHHYFSDQTLSSWYRILHEFEAYGAEHYLTGHQGVGSKHLLNETKHWITTYLGLMGEEVGRERDPEDIDGASADARRSVVEEMKRRFPDWFDPYYYEGKTVLEQCADGHRSEMVGAEVLARSGA